MRSGNPFKENLLDAISVVPLKKSGYFADPSARKGTARNVRVFECDDPARVAYDFQAKAGRNYVGLERIKGKGYIMTMADGTRITYRLISSSKDHSPVVELKVRNFKRVKSQKIHFVPRGGQCLR